METLIHDWGYIIIFLYSFGGGFVALVVGGVLSYAGDLNIVITIITAGVANFLGDQFLFFMARNNRHYAKDMMKKHSRKVALAHLMMRKQGDLAIILQKYIYGIKTLIPLAIGLTKYNTMRFLIFNSIATIIWASVVGLLSYMFGKVILTYTDEFKMYGLIIIALIITSFVIFFKRVEKR